MVNLFQKHRLFQNGCQHHLWVERREASKGGASEEVGGPPEEGKTHPFLGEFLPGPAGVVGPVKEGLRVGHQAEDPSHRDADPRDSVYGAVGVGGVVRRCLAVILIAVLSIGFPSPMNLRNWSKSRPFPPAMEACRIRFAPVFADPRSSPSRKLPGRRKKYLDKNQSMN